MALNTYANKLLQSLLEKKSHTEDTLVQLNQCSHGARELWVGPGKMYLNSHENLAGKPTNVSQKIACFLQK